MATVSNVIDLGAMPGVLTVNGDRLTSITTGSGEVDKKLGGGIPVGSLTLIEGQSGAGKSVLTQQLTSGALISGVKVAYFTTENTVKSLIDQTASLGMEMTDYYLMDRLRIMPVPLLAGDSPPEAMGNALIDIVHDLPPLFSAVMIDSVTNLIVRGSEAQVIEFFSKCKTECDRGRTIFLIAHAHAFNEQFLTRVRSLCDAHLSLKTEAVGETLMKIMEVAKVRGAQKTTGNIVSFDVEPGLGMNIIPVSKAKA